MTPTVADKRRRFAELHRAPGCFVMPNPYDVGSAKYLASLGFPALATSSAGMAFAAGLPDGGVTRADALSHIRDLAAAVDCPLNADFEAGFARDAEGVYESARLCIGAGVAGFSIEDFSGEGDAPLYALREAVERLRAARAAIDASGETVLLTARSEAIWREGAGGLPEALRRLAAYAEAGADVLVRAGREDGAGRRGGRAGRRRASGQRRGRRAGPHPPPARGSRRKAHLDRFCARPRGLGRAHARGARNGRERTLRRFPWNAFVARDRGGVREQGPTRAQTLRLILSAGAKRKPQRTAKRR